jgi:hypothetical protein
MQAGHLYWTRHKTWWITGIILVFKQWGLRSLCRTLDRLPCQTCISIIKIHVSNAPVPIGGGQLHYVRYLKCQHMHKGYGNVCLKHQANGTQHHVKENHTLALLTYCTRAHTRAHTHTHTPAWRHARPLFHGVQPFFHPKKHYAACSSLNCTGLSPIPSL